MKKNIIEQSLYGTAVDLQHAQSMLNKTSHAKILAYSAWYAGRAAQTHLGASEIGTLLGVNPWQTRHQLWRRKHGHEPRDPPNARMMYGTHMEPFVLQLLADELPEGDTLQITSTRDYVVHCTHRALPWATCSPDALVQHADGTLSIVEAKTTQSYSDVALWDALQGRVPDTTSPSKVASYWLQVIWQQIVCRVHRTILAVCHGTDLHQYVIESTPEIRKLVGETVRSEWERCLRDGREPAARGPDLAALATMYPPEPSDPAPTIDDPTLVALAEEWAQIRQQTSDLSKQSRPLEERAKDIRARLAQAMGREGVALFGEYEVRRTVTTVTPDPYIKHDVRIAARKPGPPPERTEETPAAELYPIPDVERLVQYLSEREDGETRSGLAKLCAPGVLEEGEADPRITSPRRGRLVVVPVGGAP